MAGAEKQNLRKMDRCYGWTDVGMYWQTQNWLDPKLAGREAHGYKAGYKATEVACGWAGAVMKPANSSIWAGAVL